MTSADLRELEKIEDVLKRRMRRSKEDTKDTLSGLSDVELWIRAYPFASLISAFATAATVTVRAKEPECEPCDEGVAEDDAAHARTNGHARNGEADGSSDAGRGKKRALATSALGFAAAMARRQILRSVVSAFGDAEELADLE